MHPRVHRGVGGVVAQKLELHQVIAGPGNQRVVVMPGSGSTSVSSGTPVRYCHGWLQREELPDRGLVVGGLLG